ncbi:cobalamin biosynthesis protein [Pararhodobacter oceanensis]|uniref:Precorrin methylase n=1 Tax=Pararhodobacter oceanensis TaxID=2172121 RepID=A0A2T8HRE0_9RHOB|nr:cobalamin biosynthesis protein [Pararhodobacter oceanensis]PVH28007.1 precorrin methylase [Pararhodobacter oceanensis]
MIVAGFGFRQGASVDSLRAALNLTSARPDLLATAASKAGSPALQALAQDLGLSIHAVAPSDLRAQATLTHSAAAIAAHGTGSVAEAAALSAAGPGARLTGPRKTSPDRMASCAIAERDAP